MSRLLTTTELKGHLLQLRNILKDFDYSSLQNIRFINLDALYYYMETVEDNPFKLQYSALQKELDYIQPYLPFTSSDRAASFLGEISNAANDEEVTVIKKAYTEKLRKDFIDLLRTTTTDVGWQDILNTCEEIRCHKEELVFATN